MEQVSGFNGEYRYLSNFWLVSMEYKGIRYPSSEHAYQAAKCLDTKIKLEISQIKSPGDAKRYFDDKKHLIRKDWNTVKFTIMLDINIIKFTKNPHLLDKLLSTGSAVLVELNTWGDTYWGVCDGIGLNCLGKILMHIRKVYNY